MFASEPLVEAGLVLSAVGAVIPLVDWSRQVGSGATSLTVTVDTSQLPAIRSFSHASMATGAPVVVATDAAGRTVFHVPRLTVADAIVLRPNMIGRNPGLKTDDRTDHGQSNPEGGVVEHILGGTATVCASVCAPDF